MRIRIDLLVDYSKDHCASSNREDMAEKSRIDRHVQRSHQGANSADIELLKKNATFIPKVPASMLPDPVARGEARGASPTYKLWRKKKNTNDLLLPPEEIPPYEGQIEWDLSGPDMARPGEILEWELYAENSSGEKIDPPGADRERQAFRGEMAFNDPVRGLMVLDGRVVRKEKGVYAFQFYTLTLGVFKLSLFYGDRQLFKGAPTQTEIVKADQLMDEPEAINVTLEGRNLHGITVGEVAEVSLVVTNLAGETIDPVMELLSVRTFGNGHWQPMNVVKQDTGVYTIFMEEKIAGWYTINVKYQGVLLTKLTLKFFDATQAEYCRVTNRPEGRVKVGVEHSFKVTTSDQSQGKINDLWEFKVIGNDELPVAIVNNTDGSYACTFTLLEPGPYTGMVTLENQHAKGSPFKFIGE